MEVRTFVVVAAVLLSLVVGAQLAYTTVGQPVGERWSDPAAVLTVPSDDSQVLDVVAAGDRDGGVVAWLVRAGDRYRVSYVSVTVQDGQVSVGDRRTVASGGRELNDLAVAVEGEAIAIAWERAKDNDVVLYRAGPDSARVVSDDPLRVAEPSVAFVDGQAVLAWQQWAGTDYTVEVASVSESGVSYHTIDNVTGGAGSPSVDTMGNAIAVTWFDANSRTVRTALGTIERGRLQLGTPRSLGTARPIGGFGGGSGSPIEMDAAASTTGVRGVWLNQGAVTIARFDVDRNVSEPATYGMGERPRIGVDEDGWLAVWVVTGRAADSDLRYVIGGEWSASGTLSRYQSSANYPSPFFGPDAAVAWAERGGESRVLISAFRESGDPRVLARLQTEPGRIAFIGLAAAALGIVTLPIMPWVIFSMIGAFYVTNRFFRRRFERVLARLSTIAGRPIDESEMSDRLESVPPTLWAAAFAVVEIAFLVYLFPSIGTAVAISFAGPVTLSLAAGIGTGLVQWVTPQRSPWRIAAIFAYFQTTALWATALPDVL